MARQIADNFSYQSKKPLDDRAQFRTVAEMNAFEKTYIPEGFITYCLEDKKNYKFNGAEWVEYKATADEYFGYYTKIDRVADYAYEAYYNDLNYAKAYKQFAEDNIPEFATGCSSLRVDNLYGRNLDWLYNEQAEFVIHTPNLGGRYASTCTCGQVPSLTDEFVKSAKYSEEYIMLPFYCVDGVNEKGVFINVNVVPAEKNNTNTFIEPQGDQVVEICANMIPRYVLDNFATAYDAVDFIAQHMRVYFSKKLKTVYGYEPHFMIGDRNETYILEFVNNAVNVINCNSIGGRSFMTNFHLTDVTFNSSGDPLYTPYTNRTESTGIIEKNNVTPHAAGLERYNLIASSIADGVSVESIIRSLMYTRTYTEEQNEYKWYSEFTGTPVTPGGTDYLNIDSNVTDFDEVWSRVHAKFPNRTRNPEDPDPNAFYGSWQTTHAVVYDLESLTAKFIFQERTSNVITVEFDKANTAAKELVYHNEWIVGRNYNRLALTTPPGFTPFDYHDAANGLYISAVMPQDYNGLVEIQIDGYTWGVLNAGTNGFNVKKNDRVEFFFLVDETTSRRGFVLVTAEGGYKKVTLTDGDFAQAVQLSQYLGNHAEDFADPITDVSVEFPGKDAKRGLLYHYRDNYTFVSGEGPRYFTDLNEFADDVTFYDAIFETPIIGSDVKMDIRAISNPVEDEFLLWSSPANPPIVMYPRHRISFTADNTVTCTHVLMDYIHRYTVYGPNDADDNHTPFTMAEGERVTLECTEEKDDYGYVLVKVASEEGHAFPDYIATADTELNTIPDGSYNLIVDGEFQGFISKNSEKTGMIGTHGTATIDNSSYDTNSPKVMGIIETQYEGQEIRPWFKGDEVFWGDGSTDSYAGTGVTHNYEEAGRYQICLWRESSGNIDPYYEFLPDVKPNYLYLPFFERTYWDFGTSADPSPLTVFGELSERLTDSSITRSYMDHIYFNENDVTTVVFPEFKAYNSRDDLYYNGPVFEGCFNRLRSNMGHSIELNFIFFGNVPRFESCFESIDGDTQYHFWLNDNVYEASYNYLRNIGEIYIAEDEYHNIHWHRTSELGKEYSDYLKYMESTPNTVQDLIKATEKANGGSHIYEHVITFDYNVQQGDPDSGVVGYPGLSFVMLNDKSSYMDKDDIVNFLMARGCYPSDDGRMSAVYPVTGSNYAGPVMYMQLYPDPDYPGLMIFDAHFDRQYTINLRDLDRYRENRMVKETVGKII